MRAAWALLLFIAAIARGGIFEFKDVEGYEKCLQTEQLTEHTKTATGAETQSLDANQIQNRCVAAASQMLAQEKSEPKIRAFIKATKAGTAHENAIELVQWSVKNDVKQCNDIELYEVINKALSHPTNDSAASNYQKAVRVAKACLKDPNYRKDFIEEKDSSNAYLAANACEILKFEKIVATCKKS